MSTQITTATNLQAPDASNPTGNANKYFTNLYTVDMSIGPNTNDGLVAFFEKYTGNKIAGQNLAGTVLYTAMAQGLQPMEVLGKFQKLSKGQLDSYLLAFLNSTRSPTSVLGIKTATKTSPYVARTVIL
jgi:hypothetical protein